MNKSEMVAAMAENSGLPKKDCDAALTAMTNVVADALKTGDKVQLVGFGTFEVKVRPARTCRHPQTGEPLEVPESRVPVFKPGKTLKDAVQ